MFRRYLTFGAFGVIAAPVSAAILNVGVYQLHDHPDANQDPPPYGIRWDGLDGSADVFTMSFDHPSSDVVMYFDGSSILITGVAYGGRDVGGAYAADAYLGLYEVDFLFNVGVSPVPGDDDYFVDAPTGSNFGTIKLPGGATKNIYDKHGGPDVGTFRLGDEDNDLGHRGFSGISGWGWLEIDGEENSSRTRDFLFTADYIGVPSPGPIALIGVAGLLSRRRR